MALSGFAGLGYQIIWTTQFGVWLGHEIVSVLAVVAAFFGGLAIGAQALGRRIGASAHPARWYGACEALIAAWALALVPLLPLANVKLAALTGAQPSVPWQWAVAFLGPFVLLLPATCAMGATLPAIERVTARLRAEGFAIGRLYAANTLGAVAGVLATAFWLVPHIGLTGATLACAALNGACAIAALWLFPAATAVAAAPPSRRLPGTRLPLLLFVTGALGIGYELAVVRVLSQVAENTVYTFAVLLAVYLLGTAAGAAFYQRILASRADGDRLREHLLTALCLSMLAGVLALWQSAVLRDALAAMLDVGAGAGFASAIAIEAALALAAFALPTLVMGALFCHLCVEAKTAGWSFGAAIGLNTLGGALAPLLFIVLLLPLIGPKLLLLTIAGGYLLLLPRATWRRASALLPAGTTLGLALLGPPLRFVTLPEGGRILSYRDGVTAAVSVVEDADGVARLRIDNRQQEGSSASGLADARQAYLPLLLHPAPQRALFLGLGTGVTAMAAAEDTALQVDAVELLPDVIAAAALFEPAPPSASRATPRPAIIAADARRFVRASARHYDVIVADLFHPARSGAGALYTTEHFAAIKARLADGGLFCQWLPLHQLDLTTLKSIVQSFLAVYPGASAMLATNSLDTPVIGLIAHADGRRFDVDQVGARLAAPRGQARRTELQLADRFAVLGGMLAGPAALRQWVADAPQNTDDRPLVTHRAPFATYAPEALPRERLLALLDQLQPQPDDLLAGADQEGRRRLAAYWRARSRFIEVGAKVRPNPDARAMLAQVRAPLLDIVRMSPDFRPAYDPLLNMARALGSVDVAQAEALLEALMLAQPARAEAAIARARLGRRQTAE